MGGDLVEAHQLFGYSMVLLGGTSNSVSVKTPRMVRECKKKDLESRYLSFGIHPESRAQETEDWRTQVHAVGLGCGSLETFADWKGGRYLIPQRQNPEFCLLPLSIGPLIRNHYFNSKSLNKFLCLAGKSPVGNQDVDLSQRSDFREGRVVPFAGIRQ